MSDLSQSMIAAPKTQEQIRKDTYAIRKAIGVVKCTYFDIVYFLDAIFPDIYDPEFYLKVEDDANLPNRLAEAIPDEHLIRVRRSVYDGAVTGDYWHRMTLAHELGHYMYHRMGTVAFARLEPGMVIPNSYNPEKQADIFAAELLMPVELLKHKGFKEIAKACGVSFAAAKRHRYTISKIEEKSSQKKKPHYKKRGR